MQSGSKSSACPSTPSVFAEIRIDLGVLPELNDQDLKDLGVDLGDRRKILRAIADLKSSTKTVAPNLAREAVTIARPQDAAQRRQVTVMFSDLVGSTALSARKDPEDLREVISVYQRCVAETIQRFGGVVVSAPWSEAVPAPLLIYKTNPNALITRPPARQVISRPNI